MIHTSNTVQHTCTYITLALQDPEYDAKNVPTSSVRTVKFPDLKTATRTLPDSELPAALGHAHHTAEELASYRRFHTVTLKLSEVSTVGRWKRLQALR